MPDVLFHVHDAVFIHFDETQLFSRISTFGVLVEIEISDDRLKGTSRRFLLLLILANIFAAAAEAAAKVIGGQVTAEVAAEEAV